MKNTEKFGKIKIEKKNVRKFSENLIKSGKYIGNPFLRKSKRLDKIGGKTRNNDM